MFRRPVKEINAEFSAEEKYLQSIQRTVRESCVAAGMSRKDTSAVLLATEEAATNIIRHAYLYEKGVIRLRVVIYRKLVVFSLIDFGRSFHPSTDGKVDLARLVESGRKGGLGFYMIRKIMDSVEYISSAGRNELRMIKRIGERPTAGKPLLRRMFSLRVRFSFWTLFIVSVIIGSAFYYIDYETSRHLHNRLDGKVLSLAQTIADQASGYALRSRSYVEFDELVVSFKRANPELELIVLTDENGRVVAHSDDIHNIRKTYEPPDSVDVSIMGRPQHYTVDGNERDYLILPVERGQAQAGLAHVVYTRDAISEPLSRARRKVALLTIVLMVFGVVGVYMLSDYFVRPIVNITRRVRRFTSGDLESELPLEGAEEFFDISKAFNEMMTRLSQDRENIVAREKMAKEIEVASQIQQTLMPRQLPIVAGLQLDAFYRAASVVGGDLYDVFRIGPERYCLVVADVSGKGVPASLVMSMLRTVIQINADGDVSARDILIRVNGYLKQNMPSGIFITVMLAVYDAGVRTIELVSAGHNPMLFCRAGSRDVRKINPKGMALGMPVTLGQDFDERMEQVCIEVADGDVFIIYTDGITEATNREGRQFGMDRLADFLVTHASVDVCRDVQALTGAIVSEVDEFAGFAPQSDDMTFVIARATSLSDDGKTDSQTGTDILDLKALDEGMAGSSDLP